MGRMLDRIIAMASATGHTRRRAVLLRIAVLLSIYVQSQAFGAGACCLEAGVCVETASATACIFFGGVFMGTGSNCSNTDCFGACCLADGSCVLRPFRDCLELGGNFQGDGTDCFPGMCGFTGSCCIPDGTCSDAMTFGDCAFAGGMWQGFDTSCETETCLGACCFENGECLDNQSRGGCLQNGGSFLGERSNCPSDACRIESYTIVHAEPTPVQNVRLELPRFNERWGARVLQQVTVKVNCEFTARVVACNQTGKPQLTSTQYFVIVVAFIEGSNPPVFLSCIDVDSSGSGTDEISCGDDPGHELPQGQCCDFDGPIQIQDLITSNFSVGETDLSGFIVNGDTTTNILISGASAFSASPILNVKTLARYAITIDYLYSPTGACCFTNGLCVDSITADDCAQLNGQYLGDDAQCQPAGACCLPDGSCEFFSQSCCSTTEGLFVGGDCETVGDSCTCSADIAGASGELDGVVNIFDLFELLANWGTAGNGANIAVPPNDLVDVFDLLDLLAAWGDC